MIFVRNNQTGDTIVEVLIAIVIVSTVLGGAYLSANRSLAATRQSQERSEALKFAEEQVERLKVASNTDPNLYFNATNVFCVDGSNNKQDATSGPSYAINGLPALAADGLGNYTNACIRLSRYHLATEYISADNIFKVHVRWLRSNSDANDEIVLTYRIDT